MKLKIHMKSGKTLVQRGVKNYNFKCNSDEIKEVKIMLYWWSTFSIIVPTFTIH